VITTIAGNGTAGYTGDGKAATAATLNGTLGLAVDSAGNVYVADTDNHVIRRIDAISGAIATVAGTGQPVPAQLNLPRKIVVAPTGSLVISDLGNHAVKQLTVGPAPKTPWPPHLRLHSSRLRRHSFSVSSTRASLG
jgi:streptogramin lyase